MAGAYDSGETDTSSSPPSSSSTSSSSSSSSYGGPKGETPFQHWQCEVDYAEKEIKKFHERSRKVVKRYVDERDAVDSPQKWFNLFFTNTNILKAALYAQMPQPEVARKYLDYSDDVARVAAMILKRSITPDCDDPRDLFDSTMRNSVLDRLIPGLGAAWLRLETDTEDAELELESTPSVGEYQSGPSHHEHPLYSGFKVGEAPEPAPPAAEGGPPAPGGPQATAEGAVQPPVTMPPQAGPPPQTQTYKRITDQRVVVEYVYWEDFIWSPCRVWEERRWTGRWVYLCRDELVKRFGEKIGRKVPLNGKPKVPNQITPKNLAQETARVCEIWDREHRKVVWYCPDCPYLLDEKEDFLNLIGFEPCPAPMLGNISTSNTVPRPDYYMVQDQYGELDTVNNRISLLVQACKVVGVYDRASEGVQRMLLEGFDNTLIPVDNWAMFAEKGGVKGQVDWLPLEQVINALQRLRESREDIKQQIYELTGIADIVRGASKASETLGAQQIKAKFASVRIKDIQDEVARFAAEILRIKAEIMVKHFDPEILRRKSNIMRTDDGPLADPALELLQSEEGFEWRITVTSDQLAQADYDMEKQDRIEMITAASSYLEKAVGMLQIVPQAGPLLVGILKWAIAGFKGARDIEGMLDKQLDELIKQPDQPEQPDPEAQKAQAEQQKMQMEMQATQQKNQMEMQAKQQEMAMQERLNAMDMQMKQLDLQMKAQELQLKEREMTMELRFKGADATRQERTKVLEQQMSLEAQSQQHKQATQFAQETHEQKMAQKETKE